MEIYSICSNDNKILLWISCSYKIVLIPALPLLQVSQLSLLITILFEYRYILNLIVNHNLENEAKYLISITEIYLLISLNMNNQWGLCKISIWYSENSILHLDIKISTVMTFI